MTYKEYIYKTLAGFGVSQDDVELILTDADIDSDTVVDPVEAKTAIYNRMSIVLPALAQNVTEGGYSISWNMDAVKLFYAMLANELGLVNVLDDTPVVNDRSYMW